MGGLPSLPAGLASAQLPGPEAKRLPGDGREVSPRGSRLGLPRAGASDNQEVRAPHNLGFSQGNNAFQVAKASPFYLRLYTRNTEWKK